MIEQLRVDLDALARHFGDPSRPQVTTILA
jgi:hypothetical protein